jgi:hypothetical protein
MIRLTALIAAPLLLCSAALAGTDVAVPPFSSLSAHSGANVKLIYGPQQRVTVVKGDLKKGRIQVKHGNTLDISGCSGMFCWGNHSFDVEVVTPKIEAVVASSGADVTASGNFPKQPHLAVQAHSGGDANLGAIPADAVDAQASSGGSADVKVLSTLNAQANSGGDVTYTGHPAHINSQTNSGGEVSGKD